MIWNYYNKYLIYYNKKIPVTPNKKFEERRQELFDDHFGWPADLASYMNNQGYEVELVIENYEIMQKQWAVENNFNSYSKNNWETNIVLEQIKRFKPDILWIPNPSIESYKYIDGAKKYYTKLAFYLGHDISNKELIMRADVLFTINEEYVKKEYPELNNIIYMGAGFSPEISYKLKSEKNNNIVFAGNITPGHEKRAEVLSFLISNGIDVKIYSNISTVKIYTKIRMIIGNIIERKNFIGAFSALRNIIKRTDYERYASTLKKYCKKPVYGMDYYRILASSKICLNIHIDFANNFSGNMRMFEVTGVNTCLITDKKKNNSFLFDVGHEIIEFSDKKDLLAILKRAKKNNYNKICDISKKGQEKTYNNHTIEQLFTRIKNHL